MAKDGKFSLAKLNFFNRLDARARVFFLLGGFVGVILLVYLGTKFLSGEAATVGPSRVANAPAGLQSVPGGQQTPEYNRAVEQASMQRAQEAKVTGGSSIPTLMGFGGQQASQTGNPCIVCSDQSANIKDNLSGWVKQGKVTPEIQKALEELAAQNQPASAFAMQLNQLVKDGKLTPEQARLLLDQYTKQHANTLLQDSAKSMDDLIKAGLLPLDAANLLLQAQKDGMSTSAYAALLRALVRAGKISALTAQKLLAQYFQQRAKEIILKSIAVLHQMTQDGELTPDVEKQLVELENRMGPVDAFSSTLQSLLAAGKMTPIVAKKVLDEYQEQKTEIGSTGSIDQMLQDAEAAAYKELTDLLAEKKITQEVADYLRGLIQRRVSMDDFTNAVNTLVQQNKLTPEISKLKIADYQKIMGMTEVSRSLSNLQANNASITQYADELKRLVQIGALTPDEAARLMDEYQASLAKPSAVTTAAPSAAASPEFAKLQQRLQQGGGGTATQPPATPGQFQATQSQQNQQEALQAQQRQMQNIMNSMSDQAQSLVSAWQPAPMEHKAGTAEKPGTAGAAGGSSTSEATSTTTSSTSSLSNTPALIKSGTLLFAVLDTEANSDYPDSPIMATVVDGKYKGAKLMGKLVTTKGVAGQMDKITLNFTIMNTDDWPKSKGVTAYGVDPDTARTALASSVNYHYLQKFGAIMATSFLQGYASSITNAGTATTGIFGTSTTHPSLNPASKIAVGLGQVGTTLGNVTQNWVNIPPTVKVDSGVGLGILFMADVS
jgi:type IV secretory pathway VirB10-like protein